MGYQKTPTGAGSSFGGSKGYRKGGGYGGYGGSNGFGGFGSSGDPMDKLENENKLPDFVGLILDYYRVMSRRGRGFEIL
ncbi:hypothetical protein Tco_0294520 [Tanacetum coccineum]